MAEPAVTGFFKRFAVKFVEVIGAGVATALSGYLLAHFSGYWSSPASTPPTVQVAPNIGAGANTSTSIVPKSQRIQPAHAASTDAKDQHVTTANRSIVRPARAVVSTKEVNGKEASAKEASAKEASAKEASAKEASAKEVSAKEVSSKEASSKEASAKEDGPKELSPKEVSASEPAASRKPLPPEVPVVDSKPSDEKAIEAEVRAALANVDASRPAPAEVMPRPSGASPLPPAAAAQPKPADGAPTPAAVAAVPPVAETAPAPAEKARMEPEPLAPVEIKSHPVAAVDASAPVTPAKEEGQDILSMIKKIPDFLRAKPSAADGDAPRPPLPVGN